MKRESLKKKLDLFFWAFMYVLPVFLYFVTYFHHAGAVSFLTYINDFSFPFLENAFNDIWQLAFGSSFVLAGFLSYLVMVEVGHLLFDFVVFIPRLCHCFFDRFMTFAGGDKK